MNKSATSQREMVMCSYKKRTASRSFRVPCGEESAVHTTTKSAALSVPTTPTSVANCTAAPAPDP
ncbi:MAG TPA: hypothetical protein PKY40_13520, partial [Burkholderiaceae bacterium]|nr:hypothetical protein [Burkholderiaceae bacterium]